MKALIFALIFLQTGVLINCQDKTTWYPFNPIKGEGVSELDQKHWLNQRAGIHGFLNMEGDHFTFEDGTPIKFWGVNICSEKPYVSNEMADEWVENLRKFGVNAVRFHKFTKNALIGDKSDMPDSAMMTRFEICR